MIHLHAPKPDRIVKCQQYCQDCKQIQPFIAWHTPYYGWDGTCLFCGGRFQDENWMTWYTSKRMDNGSIRRQNILRAEARYENQTKTSL
jgi:hypothetical protein